MKAENAQEAVLSQKSFNIDSFMGGIEENHKNCTYKDILNV